MRSFSLLILAALVLGSAAYLRTPQRQQELRVLITGRNMVEAADPLHFEFQNQPRYRKPPLAYWVAGGGFALTGQTTAAWAGRLLFVVTALAGLCLFRDLAGKTAAVLLFFTYGCLVYAPLAETDFLQLTGLMLAFLGWKRKNGLLAGLGMAMAGMAKGPGGVAVPLLSFLFLQRSRSRSIGFWLPALMLPALAGGGWIFYLLQDPVASAALSADLKATFIDTAHRNPLLYYVWTLLLVMIPAVFLLPWADQKPDSPDRRPALTWFWVTFLLLTLTVSKQRHYALMLLPPACWWLSLRLSRIPLRFRWMGGTAVVLISVNALTAWFSEDALHARFLSRVEPNVLDAKTLHVVGINSARFDFHIGRHVENTDSTLHAYRRAEPGDVVVVVKQADQWEESDELPLPVLAKDEVSWIRRVYQKQ